MNRLLLASLLLSSLAMAALPARAAGPLDKLQKAAGKAATGAVEKEVNKRLLAESRKNQCSFVVDSDRLSPGCDPKAKRLANAIVDAKARLSKAGAKGYHFEVSGHTDSTGRAEHNRELSKRRAEAIKRELVKKGIPEGEISTVGKGSDDPRVTPDDTPKKRALNRRYEIQVRL